MEEKDIFKTETVYDRMVHTEWVHYVPLTQPGNLLLSIVIEVGLLLALTQFHSELYVYGFITWSAVFLAAHLFFTQMRLKKGYQKILQNNCGQPPHNRIHIGQDGIRLVNPKSGDEQIYPYSAIRSVTQTPKLVLLPTENKTCILLQKCWLQGGTADELLAFLVSQCPRVRKSRGFRLGLWLRRIVFATMIAGSFFGLVLLSGNPVGLTGSKSYTDIAADLSPLGITIREETINNVESFYEEYAQMYPGSGPTNTDKTLELLFMEGMGSFDVETLEWTPSDSGVYRMDMEVFFIDSIYTDFFAGLSAMDEELQFSNVKEDYSNVDIESGVGILPVSFDWNGQTYHLDAQYNYDWFDPDVLIEVIRIVNSAEGDNRLYYAYDGGQGFLFYYGTAQQARILSRMTGLRFSSRAFLNPQIIF